MRTVRFPVSAGKAERRLNAAFNVHSARRLYLTDLIFFVSA